MRMHRHHISRRSFLTTTATLTAISPFAGFRAGTQRNATASPLVAYVGTFSSPLKDTLPTQVDLPPGNGRGIHIFRVDRGTGAMSAGGIVEIGTSPNCLALNADGTLQLLNTVRTGGAGPTYVSVHPRGRHLLVANYFGGSVAVLPISGDGTLGEASDVKVDTGPIGP